MKLTFPSSAVPAASAVSLARVPTRRTREKQTGPQQEGLVPCQRLPSSYAL